MFPGLAADGVDDAKSAPFDFAGGCIDDPVLLPLLVDGLTVEHDDAQLCWFEVATTLKGGHQLFIV